MLNNAKSKIKTNLVNGNSLEAKILSDEEAALIKSCKDKLDDIPDINYDRVMALKEQIESGTYDFDKNLDVVVDRLVSESANESPIAFPLFD
tara:strand:+ start:180 stop:455 length:276 start_codon:yes stop_codon:yes gene_type:complete